MISLVHLDPAKEVFYQHTNRTAAKKTFDSFFLYIPPAMNPE
jgi:hypothetical protein